MSSGKISDLPESHQRVLDAAWQLILDKGSNAISMAEIGRRAVVSRQAVYLFFGSRPGLLEAMTRRKDETSGMLARMAAARARDDAWEAIETVMRTWLAYLPEIEPVAFALIAAAATDPEANDAWNKRMAGVRGIFRLLTRRLAGEARLADGWDETSAGDFLFSLCHFTHWRTLVRECGWQQQAVSERIVETAGKTLLAGHP